MNIDEEKSELRTNEGLLAVGNSGVDLRMPQIKSGMEDIDKEKVRQNIQNVMNLNSDFNKRIAEKEENIKAEIEQLKTNWNAIVERNKRNNNTMFFSKEEVQVSQLREDLIQR